MGDPDKAILIAWIGLPDNHYPTEEEDWEGSMCLPRELRLKNGKLVQSPVEGFAQLRGEEIPAEGKLPAVAEVELTFAGGDADVALFTKADGSGGLTIHYDEAGQVVTVDRTGMNKRFNTNVFEVLDMPLTSPLKKMSVYIDRSSVEIFANDGEETFTTHLYPEQDEFGYQAGDNVAVRIWPLQASNSNEFVV